MTRIVWFDYLIGRRIASAMLHGAVESRSESQVAESATNRRCMIRAADELDLTRPELVFGLLVALVLPESRRVTILYGPDVNLRR